MPRAPAVHVAWLKHAHSCRDWYRRFSSESLADKRYRTTPLKGQKGGFYHDGRFATPNDVVKHYNKHLSLGLTDEQSRDLSEYLKSL